MTSTAATVAGRYRLCERLGAADLGVLWHAYDELLQRDVAIREVEFPEGVSDADRDHMAQRTLDAAREVACIDTPAAVRVFDIVEQDDRPWIVTELVRGRTLTEVLGDTGYLPPSEVARVGLCLLEALEAAHRAGVVHRDVKPSNVIIGDDGRIALAGFGLVTDQHDAIVGGVVVGSPPYLAPERAAGEPPTLASDLWAMAATLWTAAEGRPPYEAATADEVIDAVVSGKPPVCVHCPGQLATLLLALMSRDPRERPGPAHVRRALEQVRRQSRRDGGRGRRTRHEGRPRLRRLPQAFDRATAVPAARPVDDDRTWPLVLAFVAVLVLTAVALSLLLQTGPS